jgi:hypothetical protein
MKIPAPRLGKVFAFALFAIFFYGSAKYCRAQAQSNERTFPQSKAVIEESLKAMRSATAGRLPALEGFTSSPQDLDRYEHGYYQAKFLVEALPSGGSLVRVSVKVTAWYNGPTFNGPTPNDSTSSHPGYQVLPSNGRLEADMLDQLAEQLAAKSPTAATPTVAVKQLPITRSPSQAGPSPTRSSPTEPAVQTAVNANSAFTTDSKMPEPAPSAPVPRLPDIHGGVDSSLAQGLNEQNSNGSKSDPAKPELSTPSGLQAEFDALQEVLKNQSHPRNLVAVKKSGTPVVDSGSLNAKILFLASAHDEFEMLDFNRDWVHVRISGLSRGWVWRDNLEMPEGIPDADAAAARGAAPVAGELFHVSREETALFPGDWAPLRGKNVKIVSVEKVDENGKDTGPQLRLEFAKSILDQDYAQLGQKPDELAGIVLIFDSSDGGMIAATLLTLQQWKAGKLSDAGLWHQCFFDPPETFTVTNASLNQ